METADQGVTRTHAILNLTDWTSLDVTKETHHCHSNHTAMATVDITWKIILTTEFSSSGFNVDRETP